MTTPQIIDVTPDNVERTGFFCKMSARGKPGYERKLGWLKARFAEGMGMKLLGGGERGFVEYIPGRYAWRAVVGADDYLVIHCLWVVGKSKGKGFGGLLLDQVERTARAGGFKGVAAVTRRGNWLIDGGFLKTHGYTHVEDDGDYDLVVRKFDPSAPDPAFAGSFAEKLRMMAPGLVVYRSDQCPYLDDAVEHARAVAKTRGLEMRVVELGSAEDVRRLSPTPYGVFAIALDGRLISPTYLLAKDLDRLLAA